MLHNTVRPDTFPMPVHANITSSEPILWANTMQFKTALIHLSIRVRLPSTWAELATSKSRRNRFFLFSKQKNRNRNFFSASRSFFTETEISPKFLLGSKVFCFLFKFLFFLQLQQKLWINLSFNFLTKDSFFLSSTLTPNFCRFRWKMFWPTFSS